MRFCCQISGSSVQFPLTRGDGYYTKLVWCQLEQHGGKDEMKAFHSIDCMLLAGWSGSRICLSSYLSACVCHAYVRVLHGKEGGWRWREWNGIRVASLINITDRSVARRSLVWEELANQTPTPASPILCVPPPPPPPAIS
jgi:hypothetical protein